MGKGSLSYSLRFDLVAATQFLGYLKRKIFLPDGGGETTRSPKLTESRLSSNLNLAAFQTKSYFSLTCSSKDFDTVGRRRLVGL